MKCDEVLRTARCKTGLSQALFAKKFSIPVRTYEQWERGIRVPPEYVVNLMLRVLDCENESNENGGMIC